MKQTYTKRYFDFVLIACSLLFFIDIVVSLFDKLEYFSIYLLRITWAFVSVLSLISLTTTKLNSERYSRFFIIINLIVPPTLILVQFLTDLLFYGANRTDLLQNPVLYIKLIIGIILYVLSIRFSREQESKTIRDYGILTILIGLFVLVLSTLIIIESNVKNLTNTTFAMKTIVGLLIVLLGIRLKSEKIKFKVFIILLSILTFVIRI